MFRAVIKVAVALIPKTKRKERRSRKISISPVFKADTMMPIMTKVPQIPMEIGLFI